ncbi:501_t:CDS:1, partial [Acaulospora morrowiae]
MATVKSLNFPQDIISTSGISTSSLSSPLTEKSALSESKHYSFSSVSTGDYFPQEFSASLQNLVNRSERESIESWSYDRSINSHTNTTIGNNEFPYFLTQQFPDQPPLPPPEFDISPSDDQILSPEELDAIFDSFSAAADDHDYGMVYRGNNDVMPDVLDE